MTIIIRELLESDLQAVNRIYNEAIGLGIATAHKNPLPLAYHRQWWHNHREEGNPMLAAEVEGQLAGWNVLSYYRKGREALDGVRETSYYVDKEFRNKGVATRLMEQIIGQSRQMELHTLVSFIMDANLLSIKIMEQFGFEVWGRLPQILYTEKGCFDHLIFGKKL